MQIKINRPVTMGLLPDHAGKTYNAARTSKGYKLTDRAVSHYVIDDSWIARGDAELVEEISDADYRYPTFFPTP